MENRQNAQTRIRDYIRDRLEAKGDANPFNDSDPLVSSGRLDSLDVVETVIFLENDFGLNFAVGFDQSLVDSVNAIMQLIDRSP